MQPHFGRLIVVSLLIAILASAAAPVPPASAQATGTMTGVIFFDNDGDGVRDAAESGVYGVSVTLFDTAAATITGPDGSYAFAGLPDGAYTVAHGAALFGLAGTTPNPAQAQITGGATVTVDFGVTALLTLKGTIFEDLNGDGFRSLGEPASANALVDLYRDANGNGEPAEGEYVASTTSDALGNYLFPGLLPGAWIVAVQLDGGAGGGQAVISLISSEAGALERFLDIAALRHFGQNAGVAGTVWNDHDGDELIDAAEPRFAGATVYLYRDANTNGIIDAGEMLARKTFTASDGAYAIPLLSAGAYVLAVDEGTLPGSFVLSADASALAFTLVDGQPKTVDIGYYDPLAVAPLRVADWKRELKQLGRPSYTPAQLQGFVVRVEATSLVFPDGVEVEDALFLPAKSEEARARKEVAALHMNLASGRLWPATRVSLPLLTTASTVGAAVDEVEALLWPPASQQDDAYRRARSIAHALNQNQGIGYGLDGVARLEMGAYRGANVTTKLAPGGDNVDQTMDQPIFLRRWGFKDLGTDAQVFEPRVRVSVKRFDNGGILEVMQVLPDGSEISLGYAVPARWNKDVNATFTFHLRDLPILNDLVNVQVRLYVRDPDNDGGPAEHARVDSAELVFTY